MTSQLLQIWIDNDGCPVFVREMAFKAAMRRNFKVTLVANSYMHVPKSPLIEMVCVSGSFDAADDHIAMHVQPGQLVVTSDVPLAARVVEKGAVVLSQRGEILDAENVQERLAVRNLMQELRSAGEVSGGPPPLGEADKKRFADAFDRLITQLLRRS